MAAARGEKTQAKLARQYELHLLCSFVGSRMLHHLRRQEGAAVARQSVAMLKRVRIEVIYHSPNTPKPAPEHRHHLW